VILDEPTAGLAPAVARALFEEHVTALTRANVAVQLVERGLEHSPWLSGLRHGRRTIAYAYPVSVLLSRGDLGELLLGKTAMAA
jgi:ABC-type branched-subunit amino acid transport system ATPase component